MCIFYAVSMTLKLGSKIPQATMCLAVISIMLNFSLFRVLVRRVVLWCTGIIEAALVVSAMQNFSITYPDLVHARDCLPAYEPSPPYELQVIAAKENEILDDIDIDIDESRHSAVSIIV